MNSLQKLLEWLANLVELLGMAWPFLLQGAMYTVLFAAVSMVLGLILGFSVAVVRVTKVPVVSQIAAVYVSAFRGTPLLVQIFVLYYGLPSVGIEFTPVTAGILALTLNVAAYLSESMRGAILGIDKGQWEAGLSVGLTWGQTLWNIITPQALRLAVPSLSNSLISLIKDTSLISVITVTELMLATKEVIAETFQPLPLYLAAAGIYWLLSALFERVQKALENRLTAPLRRRRSAAGVEAGQADRGAVQFILVEYQHAHALEGGGGNALAGDPVAVEAPVVVLQVAAGRTARLEHGHPDVMAADQLHCRLRTQQECFADILAVDGEDPVQPVQHFAALAAGDLRWRAGRRQASGDLRAKGDDPPLRMPAREQVERAMAATVVAHQVAQQATADQNLLHGCSTPLTGTQSSPPLADGHAR